MPVYHIVTKYMPYFGSHLHGKRRISRDKAGYVLLWVVNEMENSSTERLTQCSEDIFATLDRFGSKSQSPVEDECDGEI